MKKSLILLLLALSCIFCSAQDVVLTFTGCDANNGYCRLNRVIVSNLTKGWQETITWPDTVLTMHVGTGMEDFATSDGFGFAQNAPNPFNGLTDVNLTVTEPGEVMMEITDVNGKIVETRGHASLHPGTHQFRINVANTGIYFLTARQNGKTSSIKMINTGNGSGNSIEYQGTTLSLKHGAKGNTTNPFSIGDQMEYVGYATINGAEVQSQHLTQAQGSSQTLTLRFTVSPWHLPTVTTSAVTNILHNFATCGGEVTADGGANVTARGICWSTSQNPTVSASHTTAGTGMGSFTSNMTGLQPGTTYYVRAYATNGAGTAYGEERSMTTLELPSVTTNAVTGISNTAATCGGEVVYDGGLNVTARGVCWSSSQNPTVSDSHTSDGIGVGSFTSNITGLQPATTYYVRAYATNGAGTAYGNQVSFTTTNTNGPCPGAATVTDADGNVYNTVLIGQQCWMKENLRTTRYADNTVIALGPEESPSVTVPYRYYPRNNSSNVATYGYLYNWKAVMRNASPSNSVPSGVQGICPTGWHVPSDAEWVQLTTYVKSQSQYVPFGCLGTDSESCTTCIAKALASTMGWNNGYLYDSPGVDAATNDATGFSAVPAGYYYCTNAAHFNGMGIYAYLWSCTEGTGMYSYGVMLYYDGADVCRDAYLKDYAHSVRCLKN